MSQVTSLVLVCDLSDESAVHDLAISDDTGEQRFVPVSEAANEGARGPCRKMLQFHVAATAVNYLRVDDLTARIERAPWRRPESVMLLVQEENEVRPAAWGFAGAAHFGQVDEPQRFVDLLAAVPS